MRNCLNCYYRSWIGLTHWCCHPAIEKRIKKPHARCIEHVYYDDKGGDFIGKTSFEEMHKIANDA